MTWLIDQMAVEALSEARALVQGATSPEALDRLVGQGSATDRHPLNGTVTIAVEGILTKRGSMLASLASGGRASSYASILDQLARAERSPDVKRVEMRIDSPGGSVDGLFEVLEALAAFSKPVDVVASKATSAAYGIAAAAGGRIYATSKASTFGSVGVAFSSLVVPELIEIASTEAPNKRPDLKTEPGRAVVREYLDKVHAQFAAAIAKGRATTVSDVNSNYGRGGLLLASDALTVGAIDSIMGHRGRSGSTQPTTADHRSAEQFATDVVNDFEATARRAEAIARERRDQAVGRFG